MADLWAVRGGNVEDEVDLRDVFRALARRRWTIVGVTLAAVLVSAVLSAWVLPPAYEASAILQPGSETRNTGNPSDPFSDAVSLAELLQSDGFVDRAEAGLGVDREHSALSVRATVVRNTQLVHLRVRARDPETARRAAELLATLAEEDSRAAAEIRRRALEDQLAEVARMAADAARTVARARAVAESELASGRASPEALLVKSYALNALATAQSAYGALLEARRSLTLQLAEVQPVRVVVGPQLPRSPVAPRTGLNVIVALVTGLMAGVLLALLREWLGRPPQADVVHRDPSVASPPSHT